MEEILKPKQDYKKLSEKFKETLTSIPDDVLIKYTQQETLEEVAENKFGLVDPILGKSDYRIGYERGLIKGAKWQEERSYSEEDMVTFSKYCLQYLFTNKNTDLTIENLFEQFNKR